MTKYREFVNVCFLAVNVLKIALFACLFETNSDNVPNIFKVIVQFEKCFWLMEHISVIM